MKRLILIRHAKAESAELTPTPDRERMLTERGRRDAERLGAWLAEHIPSVDAIVASPCAQDARNSTHMSQQDGARLHHRSSKNQRSTCQPWRKFEQSSKR